MSPRSSLTDALRDGRHDAAHAALWAALRDGARTPADDDALDAALADATPGPVRDALDRYRHTVALTARLERAFPDGPTGAVFGGAAADRRGRLWMTLTFEHRIALFDEGLVCNFSFGRRGSEADALRYPLGLDLRADVRDHLLVSDAWNHRVVEAAFDGAVLDLCRFHQPGGDFEVADVRWESADVAWLLDRNLGRLRRVNLAEGRILEARGGRRRREWEQAGPRARLSSPRPASRPFGQVPGCGFQTPSRLARDARGRWLVLDEGNDRIVRLDGDESIGWDLAALGADPVDLCLAGPVVLVLFGRDARVAVLDGDGVPLAVQSLPWRPWTFVRGAVAGVRVLCDAGVATLESPSFSLSEEALFAGVWPREIRGVAAEGARVRRRLRGACLPTGTAAGAPMTAPRDTDAEPAANTDRAPPAIRPPSPPPEAGDTAASPTVSAALLAAHEAALDAADDAMAVWDCAPDAPLAAHSGRVPEELSIAERRWAQAHYDVLAGETSVPAPPLGGEVVAALLCRWARVLAAVGDHPLFASPERHADLARGATSTQTPAELLLAIARLAIRVARSLAALDSDAARVAAGESDEWLYWWLLAPEAAFAPPLLLAFRRHAAFAAPAGGTPPAGVPDADRGAALAALAQALDDWQARLLAALDPAWLISLHVCAYEVALAHVGPALALVRRWQRDFGTGDGGAPPAPDRPPATPRACPAASAGGAGTRRVRATFETAPASLGRQTGVAAVTVDPQGCRVAALRRGPGALARWAPGGTAETWGATDAGAPVFGPLGYDGQGVLWALEASFGRCHRLGPDGVSLGAVAGDDAGSPRRFSPSFSPAPEGGAWLYSRREGRLWRLSSEGLVADRRDLPPPGRKTEDLAAPFPLALTAARVVFVAPDRRRLHWLGDGREEHACDFPTGAGGVGRPGGPLLATGGTVAQGLLWLCDPWQRWVFVLEAEHGTVVADYGPVPGCPGPVATGSDGAVYLALLPARREYLRLELTIEPDAEPRPTGD